MVSAGTRADASGNLNLSLAHPLRVEPTDNDEVRIAAPVIEGHLTEAPSWTDDISKFMTGFQFTIEEAR